MYRYPEKNFFKGDFTSRQTYPDYVNWSDMDELNVQNSWTFILNHIEHCVDNFTPLKTDKTSKRQSQNGWTITVCEQLKKKYHAWKRLTSSRSYLDSTNYCDLGNKASKAVH